MAYEFSPDEVAELHAKFVTIDSDKNGFLSRQEWNAALAEFEHRAEDFDFADINKDDNLSFPEYVKLISEIHKRKGDPGRAQGTGLIWQQVWDAYDHFRAADSAGRGYISPAQLAASLGVAETSPTVKRIMTTCDKEKTNQLTMKDYLHAVQLGLISFHKASQNRAQARRTSLAPQVPARAIPEKLRQDAEAAFRRFDTDNSGTINITEFAGFLKALNPRMPGPEINRLFAALDIDRSGQISLEEFMLGCAAGMIDLAKLPSSDYEWEIPHKDLVFGSKLGEGTFGVVYKGSWRGTPVAIKMLKVEMANDVLQDFRDEIAILGKLRHPSVILFMGACTVPPNFCIVTEYMEGGSVYDAMHRRKAQLKKARILKMATQIAQGINYLHKSQPKIVHRDLKSLNCLVDDNWNIKIADFGLSCVKSSKEQLRDQVGTPAFMAPELLNNKAYNEKVDVYSFAMCLWELVTGDFPFSHLSFENLQVVVPQGRRPEIPPSCNQQIASLIKKCWSTDPSLRPDFDEIIAMLDEIRSVSDLAASDKIADRLKLTLLKSKQQMSNVFDPLKQLNHKAKLGLSSIVKKK